MTGIKNIISEWVFNLWDNIGSKYQWHKKRMDIVREKRRQKDMSKGPMGPMGAKGVFSDDNLKRLRKKLDKE